MYSDYLTQNFNRQLQDETVQKIRKVLKDNNIQFDGFVVTGVSGMLMGAIMARSLRKDLVVVRKEGDSANCYYRVENYKPSKKYIFLDDLICSGKTYKAIKKGIEDIHDYRRKKHNGYTLKTYSKIIGKILYCRDDIKFESN